MFARGAEVPASPVLYVPSGISAISDVALGLAQTALAETRGRGAAAGGLIELTIRSQHDLQFKRFAEAFRFIRHDEEKLAVLWLFRKAELPCRVDELSVALEYLCHYDGLLPTNVASMRFFASLRHFSQGAAAAFARALSVVPQLDPEWAFRSVASAFMIRQEYAQLSANACVAYFNDASVIDGMHAFPVQRFVCIRKREPAFSDTYADAIVAEGDFIRFVLGVYTDCRLKAVEIIRQQGARSTLCCPLIRTYLNHQDSTEATLTEELLATVRGRPSFAPVRRFLITPDCSASPTVRPLRAVRHEAEPVGVAKACPTALPLAEPQA